jgi:RNA polymerase sigma-70 factor, ECF subfamily
MLYPGSNLTMQQAGTGILVQLAQAGEASAFCELLGRHLPTIRRAAISILKNVDDAEDAIQEASLRAFRGIESFDGRSSFSTWLTRIAINCCLMQLRQKRTKPTDSLDELVENSGPSVAALVDSYPTPEEEYARTELRQRLRRALWALPERLRGAAHDHLLEDITISESASRQGSTKAATKSRRLRARARLSRSLSRELERGRQMQISY